MFKYHKNKLLTDLFRNVIILDVHPISLNLVNGENNQIFTNIPREDSAISLKDSYPELDFNVTHRAGAHKRYVHGDHIRLVNLGPIALFTKYR